jgi:hypothetical protein
MVPDMGDKHLIGGIRLVWKASRQVQYGEVLAVRSRMGEDGDLSLQNEAFMGQKRRTEGFLSHEMGRQDY